MDNIHLNALTPDDWQIFKNIRIRALQQNTRYFCCDPEKAKSYPKSYWTGTLDGQGKQVFGLFDERDLIGITAVFTHKEDPNGKTGLMAMSFIERAHRGQGYSSRLYDARIDFAKEHTAWKRLIVSHRAGNSPSQRAILKNGFVPVGQEKIDWPDGTRDLEYKYELDLEKLREEN